MPEWLDDFLWAYSSFIYGLGVNAILGLSMYAVLALGQLSLGQAAFMGIGAYTSAVLTVKFGVPFPPVLCAAMAVPAIAAMIIGVPTLRLTGVYLAIATIGFGEVMRILYINTDYVGGALGFSGIPQKAQGSLIFGLLAVILAGLLSATRSKLGRAFEAIREDEDAARAIGIHVTAYKLAMLVISAALAGLAGALNAHFSSFIGPNEYGFDTAVTILSFAVLGGATTPLGPVLGAFHSERAARGAPAAARFPAGVQRSDHRAGGSLPPQRNPWFPHAQGRMSEPLLQVDAITCRFAGLVAVDDLSFAVAPGAVHALIGPNGAGKTTLFNMISGLLNPNDGSIRYRGRDITLLSAHARVALGIGRTFQNLRVFAEMSVLENVLAGRHARLASSWPATVLRLNAARSEERAAVARAHELLRIVKLEDQAEQLASALAYGDQRRLEIARALATDPTLLLLDEPAAGMNPTETAALAVLLQSLRSGGLTILLVEHDMNFVMGLCDHLTVLNFGRKIAEGAPSEIRVHPDVIEAYLGGRIAAQLQHKREGSP
jgi:branched-chain amino acid transport system ATP-binding protein/branched-chain amino acid transport system permease protein